MSERLNIYDRLKANQKPLRAGDRVKYANVDQAHWDYGTVLEDSAMSDDGIWLCTKVLFDGRDMPMYMINVQLRKVEESEQ